MTSVPIFRMEVDHVVNFRALLVSLLIVLSSKFLDPSWLVVEGIGRKGCEVIS